MVERGATGDGARPGERPFGQRRAASILGWRHSKHKDCVTGRGPRARRPSGCRYGRAPPINIFIAVVLATVVRLSAHAQTRRPIVAAFAHPDDERVIGPASRLAREGRETLSVIATDGSKGVRDFAHIPAGAELAAARTERSAVRGQPPRRAKASLIGLPGWRPRIVRSSGQAAVGASRRSRLRSSPRRSNHIRSGRGTGHPDHGPQVGDVVTQIVQSDARYANGFTL